jgi:hypothetical protein
MNTTIQATSEQALTFSCTVRQHAHYLTRLLYEVAPARTPHLNCNLGRVRQILEALHACGTAHRDRHPSEAFTPGLRRIAKYLPKDAATDEAAIMVVKRGLAELKRFQKQTGLGLYIINSPDWREVAFGQGDKPATEFYDVLTATLTGRMAEDYNRNQADRRRGQTLTAEEMARREDVTIEWLFDALRTQTPEPEVEPEARPQPPLIDLLSRSTARVVRTVERTVMEIPEPDRQLAYIRQTMRAMKELYVSHLKTTGHDATIMADSYGVIHGDDEKVLSDTPESLDFSLDATPKSETQSSKSKAGQSGSKMTRFGAPNPMIPLEPKTPKTPLLADSDLRHNQSQPAPHLGDLLAAAKDSGTDALQAAGYSLIPLFPADVSGKCTCREGDRCGSAGKHPLTARGVKDAGVDVLVNTATSNVGLATGKINGVIVLDVDPRNGGEESLQRLSNAGLIPATLTIATGGGGLHFYFEYPDKPIRGNRTLPGYPGVDIKSDGGYVVCPPSRTGEAYRVAGRPRPPAPLEPELLKLLLTEPPARRIPGAGAAIGAFSPAAQGHSTPALKEGEGRNNWLFRALIAYRARGADMNEVWTEAHRINAAFADPLSLSEFEATVRSAINRPATLPGYEVAKS